MSHKVKEYTLNGRTFQFTEDEAKKYGAKLVERAVSAPTGATPEAASTEALVKAETELEAAKAEAETAKAELEAAKAEAETAKAELEAAKAEAKAKTGKK